MNFRIPDTRDKVLLRVGSPFKCLLKEIQIIRPKNCAKNQKENGIINFALRIDKGSWGGALYLDR